MLKLLLTTAYYEENFFVLQCLAFVVDDSNLRIPWQVTETQKTVSGQSPLLQVTSSISKASKVTLPVPNNFTNTTTGNLLLSHALPC